MFGGPRGFFGSALDPSLARARRRSGESSPTSESLCLSRFVFFEIALRDASFLVNIAVTGAGVQDDIVLGLRAEPAGLDALIARKFRDAVARVG